MLPSLMIALIAMLFGMWDIISLILLASVNACMCLFGMDHELLNGKRAAEHVDWSPFCELFALLRAAKSPSTRAPSPPHPNRLPPAPHRVRVLRGRGSVGRDHRVPRLQPQPVSSAAVRLGHCGCLLRVLQHLSVRMPRARESRLKSARGGGPLLTSPRNALPPSDFPLV